MIPRNSLEDGVSALKLEAIDWAARLAIGPVAEDERVEFESWRRSSPAHEDAFRVASEFMDELHALDIPPQPAAGSNIVPLRPKREAFVSRRAFMSGGAVAATLVAGVVAARSPLGLWPSLSELTADERTQAGERRTFSPMAGVDVELNSRSSVSIIDQGVELIAGQVFVAVKRTSPFRIAAANGTATVTDGHVDVRAYDSELCIACIEGRLTASIDNVTHQLAPGQSVTYRTDGSIRQEQADPQIVTAWRRGLLIFEGTPLARAISDINRYYPGRLVLRGSGLAARPVTGVFHINQIELALVQIQNLTKVSATRLPGGVVLLG